MEVNDKLALMEEKIDLVQNRLIEKYEATPHEAKEFSAHALETQLSLTRVLKDVKNEIIKLNVMKDATYKKAFTNLDDKLSVSKQKALAVGDREYQKALIGLERMDNIKDYVRGMIEVCGNAYYFFKSQFSE